MELKETEDRLIYQIIAGSKAYGLSTPESDTDLRGIYRVPKESYLGFINYPQQVSDNTNDTTYYDLKRFFSLAKDVNPNIIEMLFMPEDSILKKTPIMNELLANRHLFISQKAKHTFGGYAHSQISRAKGRNKLVHNPKPKDPPSKLDFCWVIDIPNRLDAYIDLTNIISTSFVPAKLEVFPFRPVSLNELRISLSEYHVAKMEHCHNMYRLYHYGRRAKGVFRGTNQQLVVESIPKEDEWEHIEGILIYNEEAYKKAHKEWKQYWEWVDNRNEARWKKQESGELDFDVKNMMHCVRLLWSGINILENGEPIVRFTGKEKDILMGIRNGEYTYEEVMEITEDLKNKLDTIKTDIPHSVNMKKINKLFLELIN